MNASQLTRYFASMGLDLRQADDHIWHVQPVYRSADWREAFRSLASLRQAWRVVALDGLYKQTLCCEFADGMEAADKATQEAVRAWTDGNAPCPDLLAEPFFAKLESPPDDFQLPRRWQSQIAALPHAGAAFDPRKELVLLEYELKRRGLIPRHHNWLSWASDHPRVSNDGYNRGRDTPGAP